MFHRSPTPAAVAPASPAPPPFPTDVIVANLAAGVPCDALWGESLNGSRAQVSELLTRSFDLRCPVGSFKAWLGALAAFESADGADAEARTVMKENLGAFLATDRGRVKDPTELNRLVAVLTLLVSSRVLRDKELPPAEWERWGVDKKADRAAALAELLAALFERAVKGAHAADLRTAYWATAAVLLFAEGAFARATDPHAADLMVFKDLVHRSLSKQFPRTDRTDGPFALFAPDQAPEPAARALSPVERARLFVGGNIARLTATGYAVIAALAVSVGLVAVGGSWFHSGRATTAAFEQDPTAPLVEELNPARPQR